MKGIRMNSKATAAALTLAIPLAAMAQTSIEDQQSKIEQALENVLSKQGLSVGGVATGEYLSSKLTGSGSIDSARNTEPLAYTQVDFDLRARPNANTTARAVFRMHLDWPNFWGSPATPIETRWLSLDGKSAAGMLYYGVGDQAVRWSPYTMWAPDVGFLYTPRLFKQGQEQAMNERFQGDNKRILQGLQFGLRASVPDIAIDSFDVGVLGAKLASANRTQAEQLKSSYPFNWGAFDRYFGAAHGDVSFLKGASVGGSFLIESDLKSTFSVLNSGGTTKSVRDQAIGRDSAQHGTVEAARGGFQADKVFELNGIKAGLNAEFAHSSWDGFINRGGKDTVPKLTGNALNAKLNVGYVIPKVLNICVTGGYLQNDSAFRNDLAQSPTFYGQRVLNTEQGWNTWNTFDAMYHNVYNFVPEANSNYTVKNPVEKNDYTNQVLDPTQYAQKQLDWNLQMVLPGGEATANRVGPKVDLDASILDGAVDLKGAFYSLQEAKATVEGSKAKYQKIQAGAKVRVDKFLDGIWNLPLEFAGSYEQNTGKAGDEFNYASTVLNAGAYIAVHKRVALLAAYQAIDGKQKTGIADSLLVDEGGPVSNKQTNLGLGVEVKVQEGAYLIGMWNKLTTKYTNLTDKDFDQDIVNVKLQMAF